jgi:hypothetical protein
MNSYYFDDYKITEFSYFEYKNLVKNLLSTEEDKLVNIFEEIIKKHVTVDRNLNIGEKIKILLLLRSMTLGEEISISLNNRIFNYDINKIIDSININKNIFTHKKLKFSLPKKINYKTKFECLVDNFDSFILNDEEKEVRNLNFEEKKVILQNLIGFKTKEITKEFNDYIKEFYLTTINEIKINLFDADLLTFIKNIFESDINEMYDIEYSIMNYLKFDPSVFHEYGLPELRIFLNKFIKEKEEQKKVKSGNSEVKI